MSEAHLRLVPCEILKINAKATDELPLPPFSLRLLEAECERNVEWGRGEGCTMYVRRNKLRPGCDTPYQSTCEPNHLPPRPARSFHGRRGFLPILTETNLVAPFMRDRREAAGWKVSSIACLPALFVCVCVRVCALVTSIPNMQCSGEPQPTATSGGLGPPLPSHLAGEAIARR